MKVRSTTVRAFLLLAATHAVAHASDGQLDNSFGIGGRTAIAPNSGIGGGLAVAEMTDGRLLIAGDCPNGPCLIRLNPDGTLDQKYGPSHSGSTSFDQFVGVPPHTDIADMILLADGRAMLAGCGESDQAIGPPALFVVRADGSGLDTSLGNRNGYFLGTQGDATAVQCAMRVRQQKDGKFVVLQNATDSVYGAYTLVTRITADMSALDSTFGSGGQAKIEFGVNGPTGNSDTGYALEIQANGAIVTGGYGSTAGGTQVMEFARLLPNGQFDNSFGHAGNGRFFHSAGSGIDTAVFDIAMAPDQRIVFGGGYVDTADFSNGLSMVGRLTSAGSFDTSFAGGNFVTYAPSNGASGRAEVVRVIATVDSVIALADIPRLNGSYLNYFEVTRFDRMGNKVSAFGVNGSDFASFAVGNYNDQAIAQVLTTRGLVVTGTSNLNDQTPFFGVARLQYEHIFSDSFQ